MVSCVPAGEHAAQVGSELPADRSASRSSKTADSRTCDAAKARADVFDSHSADSANNTARKVTSAVLAPIRKVVARTLAKTTKSFSSARSVLVDAVVAAVIHVSRTRSTKCSETAANHTTVVAFFVHRCRELGAANSASDLVSVQSSNAKQGSPSKQLTAVSRHKTRFCFLVFHALVFARLLSAHPSHAISTFGVDSLFLEL